MESCQAGWGVGNGEKEADVPEEAEAPSRNVLHVDTFSLRQDERLWWT